jgi:hypothetical protein
VFDDYQQNRISQQLFIDKLEFTVTSIDEVLPKLSSSLPSLEELIFASWRRYYKKLNQN